jgi:hypothetical protein
VVGGKRQNLAGCAIDPDPRAHLVGMAFDAALKLPIAIMGKPDRAIGKEHRRQRRVEHERSMIASAEPAADIGELGVDMRRLERGFGVAQGTRVPIFSRSVAVTTTEGFSAPRRRARSMPV